MAYFIYSFLAGLIVYSIFRVAISGFYVVRPDQRAVITSFGRAERMPGGAEAGAEDPNMSDDERARYHYPRVRVVPPGGPYFKWPWQAVHKVSVATEAVDLAWDPTKHQDTIEAVTKDNLTTGVNGQIRYRVSEGNLYAYLFGVDSPLEHIMGFFVSVLRERIATFVDPKGEKLLNDRVGAGDGDGDEDSFDDESVVKILESPAPQEITEGVSINDLRKNLPLLNSYMEEQCRATPGRYGVELEAALITAIDPPQEVDRALSAINTTRNQVAADISTAQADAEQQITMSERAVEIAANNAQAEVAPLRELAKTLTTIKDEGGSKALAAYVRNLRVDLYKRAKSVIQVSSRG